MNFRYYFLAALCVVGLAEAEASTVTAAAEVSSGFSYKADPSVANSNSTISSNTPLKSAVASGNDILSGGAQVLIGNFGLTDAQIQANATNLTFLLQNFVQYGAIAIGSGVNSTSGYFSGTLTNNTTSLAIANAQIYMFVIAGTNNASVSASIASAFQIGVYYESMTANAKWKFPAENAVPNTTQIDLANLTSGANGGAGVALDPGAHVVIGSFGPDKSNAIPTATNFSLASVPEPTSAFLLMVGVGSLAARRRRS